LFCLEPPGASLLYSLVAVAAQMAAKVRRRHGSVGCLEGRRSAARLAAELVAADPTRAELCRGVASLTSRRECLQAQTSGQRAELEELSGKLRRLQGLREADDACRRCAELCAEDLARLEVGRLRYERRALEREVAERHREASRGAARGHSEAAHAAAREAWLAECRRLVLELGDGRARVADLEREAARRQLQGRSYVACSAAGDALRDELLSQRAARQAQGDEFQALRAELEELRERRRRSDLGLSPLLDQDFCEVSDPASRALSLAQVAVNSGGSAAQLDFEASRQELMHEAEERMLEGEMLRDAKGCMDTFKRELHDSTVEGTRLRASLQEVVGSLEHIQRQTAEALDVAWQWSHAR